LLGGCHFILHAAGWLEGGLTASCEKFILDVEMLQMFAELFQPVLASAEEIGIEAVAEVGPGGHFFSVAHTMQRYRDAFYTPLVSDWRNYGASPKPGACRRRLGGPHHAALPRRLLHAPGVGLAQLRRLVGRRREDRDRARERALARDSRVLPAARPRPRRARGADAVRRTPPSGRGRRARLVGRAL